MEGHEDLALLDQQGASKRNNNLLPPLWGIASILIFVLNESMTLSRDTLYLGFIFTAILFIIDLVQEHAWYQSCFGVLPKLLSASTKFVRGILKLVSSISLKKVFVLSLIVFNPQTVSSGGTYNSSAVTSPLAMAPQTLNNTPSLPMLPSPVPKGGARRLVPPSLSKMRERSNFTESEREWGLKPKKSPPSCLPRCY